MKQNILKSALIILVSILTSINTYGQNTLKELAFIEIDLRSSKFTSSDNIINSMVRVELEKTKKFQILDKYDIEYISKRDSLNIKNCFSKLCMNDLGKKLKVDYMFTGNIDYLSDKIILTFRLFNVNEGLFEKTEVNEYLNLPTQIRSMIVVSMNNMFGIVNDQALVNNLTKTDILDNMDNNPRKLLLRTDGPRMGFSIITGEAASIMSSKRAQGGYNVNPYMFQFGYQFEKQYLNSGNFQALVEFIPMISGLDQGMFIPSFSILNGLRNNSNGFEFAFGPTFSLVNKAQGYYDSTNRWTYVKNSALAPNQSLEHRLDSRGTPTLQSGFVFAFGKTFKSGRLNIPVNGYIIPNRDGMRFGLSFGFNAKDRYAKN